MIIKRKVKGINRAKKSDRQKVQRKKLSEFQLSHNVPEWTQSPLEISMEYGPTVAMLWSIVNSYENMSGKVCMLSFRSLGLILHVSPTTIHKSMKILIKGGYIRKTADKSKEGKPNWYETTSKLYIKPDPK